MNITLRLITAVLVSFVSLSARGAISCNSSTDGLSVVLVESENQLKPLEKQRISYVDWGLQMTLSAPYNFNSAATATFLYTTTVMNFLELASLHLWSPASNVSDKSLFETRLGLFFLQLNQSPVVQRLWVNTVNENIDNPSKDFFYGFLSIDNVMKSFSTFNDRDLYIDLLAQLVTDLGERLHKLYPYGSSVTFSNIPKIRLSPTNMHMEWQNLLEQLVHWQFQTSMYELQKFYCKAADTGAEKLVIKIPPTPLLDYYIQEFDSWGRENNLSISLQL